MSNSFNTPSQVSDPSTFEMPYGQHIGQPLASIPKPYLRWMYANNDFTYFVKLQRAIVGFLNLPPDPVIREGNEAARAFARGTPVDPPSGRPGGLRGGSNGSSRYLPQTGLAGFTAAFERARKEILTQFSDDQDLVELMDDILGRVRKALGI